jgi:hypothetical protein
MIITGIECFPLRLPLKPGKSDESAWGLIPMSFGFISGHNTARVQSERNGRA